MKAAAKRRHWLRFWSSLLYSPKGQMKIIVFLKIIFSLAISLINILLCVCVLCVLSGKVIF